MARGTVGTMLVRDRNGGALQILEQSGERANLTAGAATSRVALPTGSEVVYCRSLDNVWIKFGDVTVEAAAGTGAQLHVAGESVQIVPVGATYIAALRVGASDATVQVEKCG